MVRSSALIGSSLCVLIILANPGVAHARNTDLAAVAVIDTSFTMKPKRAHRASAGVKLLESRLGVAVPTITFKGNSARQALASAVRRLAKSRAQRKRIFMFWVTLDAPNTGDAIVAELRRRNIGVTYIFVDDLGPFGTSGVSAPDREYIVANDRALPTAIHDELVRLGWWSPARFTRWWQRPSPCPPGAAVSRRTASAGKVIACTRGDGALHGRRTAWTGDGVVMTDARYRAGKRHGVQRRWHGRHVLHSRSSFRIGKRHGRHRVWSVMGVLSVDGRYRDGVKVGRWTYYKPDGSVLDRVRYDHRKQSPKRPPKRPEGKRPPKASRAR